MDTRGNPGWIAPTIIAVLLSVTTGRSDADCWEYGSGSLMGGETGGICTFDGLACLDYPVIPPCSSVALECVNGIVNIGVYPLPCSCTYDTYGYSCSINGLGYDFFFGAVAICPNGVLDDPGEQCDDGDEVNGDGCSSSCVIEQGWTCSGEPSACTPICGDGLVHGSEQCDDGNTADGDGCSSGCTIEAAWSCAGQPSVCTPGCGDGHVHGSEQCDDGNLNGGDGCSGVCTIETGWSCSGQPSVCTLNCGNGILDPGEQCDDGNVLNGDCCSSTCQFEAHNSPCDDHDACTTNDTCNGAGTCTGGPPPNCDDGNLCTQDSCDSGTGCVHDIAPVTGCKAAGKSFLLLKNSADDTEDTLTWKWLKGAVTTPAELGVPTSSTNYALCVYAGTAVATIDLPAGSKWRAAGTSGFQFKDPAGTPNGVQKASLKSGGAGKAKALVKGKGANLPDTFVGALTLPVTAQLVNETANLCFGSVYTTADVIKNDGTIFKAKH